MSLIPLDEPRGDSRSAPSEGEPSDALFGRLRALVASALRTLIAGSARESDPGKTPESTPALEPATERQDGTEGRSSASRTERTPLEMVSAESEERLTLADANNPEAKISSDTWERVEP